MKKHNIKLVTIGDGTVGKTCVLIRFKDDQFPEKYIPTLVENYNKDIIVDNQQISLNIWDTAGQEEYERLRHLSYPGTNIFLIVFDITSSQSFDNAIQKWANDTQKFVKNSIHVIVGNKIDKLQKGQVTPYRQVIEAKGQNFHYFECSALTGQGIQQLFEECIRIEIKKRQTKKTRCSII